MEFRKDINSLRAIAVIAVMIFHFNKSWLPGGFSGVDVFFVISGYLMTKIIFKGMREKNFSLVSFYISRANRIIPPLAFLCLILLILGWFILTPLDYKILGKHIASSVIFISNILYWKESGYFDLNSYEKWLLHTWSLSVEWQFYIFYPIGLLFFNYFFKEKTIKFLFLISTILLFLFCIFATYKWPNPSYFLLPTRAWEMLLGGIAFLFPFQLNERLKKYFFYTGLIIIIVTLFVISSNNLWPGFLALFPTFGCFLVIQANYQKSILTNNIFFQKIGKWSYSIYLWHWPIVVIIYYYSLNIFYVCLGIIFSIFLGFLSYKFIEKNNFSLYYNWKFAYKVKPIYFSFVLLLMGLTLYKFNGFNNEYRYGASTDKAKFIHYYEVKYNNLYESYWLKCNTYAALRDKHTFHTDPTCVSKQKAAGGVFLWGDSHAEALSYGIRSLLLSKNIPFYQKTSAGCTASLTETKTLKDLYKKACDYSNRVALDSIQKIKPNLVVIAQANHHDETDWIALNKRLNDLGVKKVILVGPVSQWNPSLPKVMIKEKNWKNYSSFVSDSGLDLNIIKLDQKMRTLKFPKDFIYISLIKNLCLENDEDHSYECRVRVQHNGDLLQVDYGHLSETGSLFVINHILEDRLLKLYNVNNS